MTLLNEPIGHIEHDDPFDHVADEIEEPADPAPHAGMTTDSAPRDDNQLLTQSNRHFKSPQQQHRAAHIGMWLFLASEIMMFGGLFCGYAVVRSLKPELFAWGHHLLDQPLGGLNTMILLISSATMALAVRAAHLHRPGTLLLMLLASLVCGGAFLVVKGLEYQDKIHFGLVPGHQFKPNMKFVAVNFGVSRKELRGMLNAHGVIPPGLHKADPQLGATLFAGTCAACHDSEGQGKPNMGANLQTSRFIAMRTDAQLLDFVKHGRMPTDPDTILKLSMPARGGNPALDDQKLYDIISHVRTLQKSQSIDLSAPKAAPISTLPDGLDHTQLPPGAPAPAGMVTPPAPMPRTLNDFDPPCNPAPFFGTYFVLTGLHGVHVLVGLIVIAWLIVQALRGKFKGGNHTPLELTAMYWQMVDLIWVALFVSVYLI
jgi:cytochrome c oxidase subunit 3